MTSRHDSLAGVELTAQGYMVHPEDWTEALAPALAQKDGIHHLSKQHWQVVLFVRSCFIATGVPPTVRQIARGSGTTIEQLYGLFPRSPAARAARIAGVPKRYLCFTGDGVRAARASRARRAAMSA